MKVIRIACISLVAAAAIATDGRADTTAGVRTGYQSDTETGFLGGEVLTSVGSSWYFNPNVEVSMTNDRDLVTLNGDFHYDFLRDRSYWVWAGAGPAVIRRDRPLEDSRTDLGVNVVGGVGWKTSSRVVPYLQGKVTISDDDAAAIALGMRF